MEETRRNFIKKTAAITGAAALGSSDLFALGRSNAFKVDSNEAFKLNYAPNFGSFKEWANTKDPVDYIKFCYDLGFRGFFDNWFSRHPIDVQEKIANELDRLGMEMGPYIAIAGGPVNFVTNDPDIRKEILKTMETAIEVHKRTGFKQALVTLGGEAKKLHLEFQLGNAIDNMRACCDRVEPEGLTLVMEPLNQYVNHPGLFLKRIPQAYAICRALNRPSCKIVDDLYHQSIQEGNLINNMDMAWKEIGAFHLGDNPGRKEPTTGEINYKNIFKHIYDKGYKGVLCMEHGNSIKGLEGEKRLYQAYRECDNFNV